MTVKEVAERHGITIQAVGKHCRNGRFAIGNVGYAAVNRAKPGDRNSSWEIQEIPRSTGTAGMPSSAGRVPDPATLKMMRESASLKKTLAQTKLIQQDISETLAGHYAAWGSIMEAALVNGFSEFSKRLMSKNFTEAEADAVNEVLSECLKSSFEELQRESEKSVDALAKFDAG